MYRRRRLRADCADGQDVGKGFRQYILSRVEGDHATFARVQGERFEELGTAISQFGSHQGYLVVRQRRLGHLRKFQIARNRFTKLDPYYGRIGDHQ